MNELSKSIVIIGAGTSGLSAAIQLTEYLDGKDILVASKEKSTNPALAAKADEKGIHVELSWFVLHILSDGNVVYGVLIQDTVTGEVLVVQSPVVVIATGGISGLYGDGMNTGSTLLALEAGASLVDLDIAAENPQESAGIIVNPTSWETAVHGLYAVGSASTEHDLSFMGNAASSMYEWLLTADTRTVTPDMVRSLAYEYLNAMKLLPDQQKLSALKAQIVRILSEKVANQSNRDSFVEAKRLVDLIQDGMQRFAVEEFSEEHSNVYETVQTWDVMNLIVTGLIIVGSALIRSSQEVESVLVSLDSVTRELNFQY